MSEERQEAHLVVCPECGKHAAIVYENGDQSESFKTKVDGKMLLLEAVDEGSIVGEDMRNIEAEIDNSTLPFSKHSEETPEGVKHFREDLQRRRLFGGSVRGVS